jgi:outer membrane protein OmpU
MKKVLLTSTALVMTAGVAAADMQMSASAKLTYGNFGTGFNRAGVSATDTKMRTAPSGYAAADSTWTSEADLDIAGSGGGGTISYSATLELDEGGSDAGAFSISGGGFTFVYDANDLSALTETGLDGEDDNTGDYSVSYSAGGLSVAYVIDDATDDSDISIGYATGDLTLGVSLTDNNNAKGGEVTTETSVSYAMGASTVSLSADDADDWDVSVAYAAGDTTVTLASDETEAYSIGLGYTAGDVSFTARQEFNNPAGTDDETEFSVSYAAGDMTFGATYDSGQTGSYGDEAETVVNVTYAIDGATIAAKANDQDEMEMSVSFAF